MSELTRCNYCTLKALERSAKAQGKILVRRRDPRGSWSKGTRFYMLSHKSERPGNLNFVSWMAEVPDQCRC